MTTHNREAPGPGGFRLPPNSFADVDISSWRRDAYTVVLVGPDLSAHQELIARTGYRVVLAPGGDAAIDLFARGLVVDAIVLDFETEGRPPEAVLLFARRAAADVQLIAIVPPKKDDAFRRAFLAGARDVLPAPARGEDLLAAIDLVLEPRGLADMVEELRARGFDDDGTQPVASVQDRVLLVKLEAELRDARAEVEKLRREKDDSTAAFRQQALDAITERDRLLESRDGLRKKLAVARRDLKERDAQLSLVERACEELPRMLKDARDQRRESEARLLELEARLAAHDEPRLRADDAVLDAPAAEVDPEVALSMRADDEQRLTELEAIHARYQESLARIQELEARIAERTVATPDPRGPAVSVEDEQTRRALEAERDRLASRLVSLEIDLERRDEELSAARAGADEHTAIALEVALAELADLRETSTEALGRLDAVRTERDGLKRRLADAEREAADALTRVEELAPLLEELERIRRELHVERQAHEALRARHEALVDGPPPPAEESIDHTPSGASAPVIAEARRAAAEAGLLRDEANALEARVHAHEVELAALRSMLATVADDTEANPLDDDDGTEDRGDG